MFSRRWLEFPELHLASLLERLEQGLLEGLTREEYDGRVRNIERLERLGPGGK